MVQTQSRSQRFAGPLCACLMTIGCADAARSPSKLLHVQADQIVDGEQQPVSLRGLQFTDRAHDDPTAPNPTPYADESDYQRAAAMGANTIALFFRSDQFEADATPYQYREAGFDWLDQNIAWAQASGVRLILTLLKTPGSSQREAPCDGNTVWDVPEYEDRTVALWQALAQRYENEPVIAGYDLLVGPVPSGSPDQWPALANRLISAIRTHDQRHLLVLEIPTGSACKYTATLSAADLFRVADPNVLYAFQANFPWAYVSQLLPRYRLADGGVYPDETRLGDLNWDDTCAAPSCDIEWKHNSWDSTPPEAQLLLKPEETSWTQQRFAYRVTNPDYQIGSPVLQSDNNLGKVFFDDLTVNEYDEDLDFVRTVMSEDLEDAAPWYVYQSGSDGHNCTTCGALVARESDAHRGQASISVSQTTTRAGVSNVRLAFPAKLNYTYELIGWIKGENSAEGAAARFRFDFYKDNQHHGVLPLRNRNSLAGYLQSFIDWGRAQGVPLFVSDFGSGRPTFSGNKGGARWVEDMIDQFKENDWHFVYREYRGDDFGVYPKTADVPDAPAVNQPLIDLLTRELTR